MPEEIEFIGKIDRIIFYSEDSSWGVLSVTTKDIVPFSKTTFDYDVDSNQMKEASSVSIVGKMPHPSVGDIYSIKGKHIYSAKYKQDQYEISSMLATAPKTIADQKAYIQSLCTEKQAEAILSSYPNIVEDILNGSENVDLELLSGIGQITWDKIKDKVISNFAISDILSLLVPIGISFNKIHKLLDNEPNPQILREKLLNNPYVIVNVAGISFKTADKIATQLNPSLKESEGRLVAFVQFILNDIGENRGHTWLTISELKNEIISNIPECEKFCDIWIEKEKQNNKIVHIEDNKIGLKRFYDSEIFIWNEIVELSKTTVLFVSEENITEGIRIAEEQLGFNLTEEQKSVVINMTKSNFSLSSGKSGTGKTTTARALLNIYKHAGYSVVVTAFTAKAAKRAQQATGFSGQTLHRLLGIGMDGYSSDINQIPYDVVFIDENSLNPLYLMKKIFEFTRNQDIKIILCGDNKQINPLGIGNVFSDLLEKDCFNKNILTQIQRQAADSGIIVDGNLIRDSIDPISKKESRLVHGINKDLIYIFKSDKDEIFRTAISSYIKSFQEKGIGNTVLLVPFKTKGLNSTKQYNKIIQQELNLENKENKFIHGDSEFWLNDFVIHIKNNYEKNIFNGSQGIITKIEKDCILVDFDGDLIKYTHEDISELELSYAITPFKFQGSEAKDCIVVMDISHYILLSNAYLYTSMTRARERCLIITDTAAYDRCMTENKSERNTWLKILESN